MSRVLSFLVGLCLIAGGPILGGCGFQPLYGGSAGTAAAPLRVDVAPIADRRGQILRTYLQNAFAAPAGPREYRLRIDLSEDLREIGIRNAYETRANLSIHSRWQLVRAEDDTRIAAGQVMETGSYDIIINDYANLSARRSTREKILKRIADLLVVDVRVALDRHRRGRRRP